MANRKDYDDSDSFGRAKYLAGVQPEDLKATRMYFGTGYHAEVMRAVWGDNWSDTVDQENKRK